MNLRLVIHSWRHVESRFKPRSLPWTFQDIKNLTELTLMDFTLDLKSVLMFSQLRVLGLMKLLIDDHMSESSLSLPED